MKSICFPGEMMKQKVFFNLRLVPLFLALFSLLSEPGAADEMYKCGGTYSNKPCDDGTSPIQTLPKLSKMGSGASDATSAAEHEMEERKAIGNDEGRPGCRVETNGADVRISDVRSTIQNGALSFIGTVRNSSAVEVTSGVSVEVRRLGGREATVEKVADSLSGGATTTFNYSPPSGSPLQSTFEFRLLYAPAKSCDAYRASGASAEPQNETGSTSGLSGQKARHAQALKDLDVLEGEIRARRAKRIRSKSDPEEVAAVVRFQSRLNSICISVAMKDGDPLDKKCQKIKEQLDTYF